MRRFIFLAAAALFMLSLFHVQPVFSQTADELKSLKEEIKSLKEGQSSIQKDLQEIKKLLQARPAAQPTAPEFKEAIVSVDGAPVRGAKTAKLVLIEFSDYQ